MISLDLDRRWRVRFAADFHLPMARAPLWTRLRDFERFACLDYFHKEVHLEQPIVGRGTRFLLEHRALGIGFMRRGRILSWQEGFSYAYSDLSLRDPRRGFPHVFRYGLEEADRHATRLGVEFSGRWTATFIPRDTVRLWLYVIGVKIARSVRTSLLAPSPAAVD